MIELYVLGTVAGVISLLWLRVKYLKNKAKASEARADRAEVISLHGAKVAGVERERNEGKAKRVKEEVDHAEQDDFSDFYDDSH